MTKTPEEMAEEYCNTKQLSYVERLVITKGFLAGYKAAKDEYKVAIDTYNDVAKQMLEEAVRIMSPKDQVADVSKVMPQWISVKDRLPEYTPMVLAMCTDGYELAYYGMYGQGWTNTLGTEHLNVTHWHSLPAPPKEEK